MLSALLELNGQNPKSLNTALAILFAARIIHVEFGLNIKRGKGPGRMLGHYITQGLYLWFGIRGYKLGKSHFGW